MDNKKLMIIDGSSLLFRAFYALPLLTTKEGIYTNAMYGFLGMLYNVIDEYKPDYISVAFDKSGPTFRHELYEEYKGTRSSAPDEIRGQFTRIKEILDAMNIHYLESDKYEADDIAGTLARDGETKGMEVVLVTGDKDYLQLVSEKTKVVITRKGITETEKYDLDKIDEVYKLTPNQLIDLKGLMGDSSDNIPGVPGIGEKTGLKLIQDFHSIDGVYENMDKITGKKRIENLENNKDLAYLSKELGTIICDADLGVKIEDLEYKEVNVDQLVPLLAKYDFNNFLNKYASNYKEDEEKREKYEYTMITQENIDGLITSIKEDKQFGFKLLINGEDLINDEVLYLAIKTKNMNTHILNIVGSSEINMFEMNEGIELFDRLKVLFEDDSIEKLGHNLKDDIVLLFRHDINIKNIVSDTMIGKYLIDPSQSTYSINDISLEFFNYYGQDEEVLLGKGKSKKAFGDLTFEDSAEYLSFYLDTSIKAKEKIDEIILEQKMVELYHDIELPLIEVLASMQYIGFEVDKNELSKLEVEFAKEIDSLVFNIHELAGRPFNVNSPKQLGEILFEDLGLPVIKKTKTGYSTNADVLDKLRGQNEIIDLVIRYREIAKLKSTYIDGLSELINNNTGRIHSTFNQTITTTGRISSTEPNLQNIPIRTHDGRQIRRAFVSADKSKLIDGDYSQIELRVLAHISEDEHMIDAFKHDIDIHTKTASQVFGVKLEDVTKDLRGKAKAVNFGIIYGISDYGLSQNLNITRNEAKEYIESYLANYEKVKAYMDDIVDFGKENGFVETIFKRRRYIPELKNKNFNIRSFGERVAMNAPIQGSAADIIKMSMVKVYNEIENRNLKSKLILQVHDELIIEAVEDEIEEVTVMLKEIMESIVELKVPLTVDLKVGDSWYDTL